MNDMGLISDEKNTQAISPEQQEKILSDFEFINDNYSSEDGKSLDIQSLKNDIFHDEDASALQKKLENYIDELSSQYILEDENRKTRRYKIIEEVHNAFPAIESISAIYVECLVTLDRKQTEGSLKKLCKQVKTIFLDFPNNESICESLAFVISQYSYYLSDNNSFLEILKEQNLLKKKFPENKEIDSYVYETQDNFNELIKKEKLLNQIKKLEENLAAQPEDINYIDSYLDTIGKASEYFDLDECFKGKVDINKYKSFRELSAKIKCVDEDLNSSILDNDPSLEDKRTRRLVKNIYDNYINYPSESTAIAYAKVIDSEFTNTEVSLIKINRELRKLHKSYPNCQYITELLASALEVSELCSSTARTAQKYILELTDLAEKYPSKSVNESLKNAKKDYAECYVGFEDQ